MKLIALTLAALMAVASTASAEVKIALDTKPDLETSGSYNWAYAFGNALKAAGMEVRELPRGAVGNEAEKNSTRFLPGCWKFRSPTFAR
ncbi:hypothetical protein QW131_31215 [Roseibium salinum]|nr:hypothetical protein [Roseibium salinum]